MESAMDNADRTPRPAQADALVVCLQRQIAAPASRVWSIISNPDGMRQWLGPQVFEPQPGGRVLIDCLHGPREDGARQRWLMFGNITAFEAERELAFSWQEFNVNDLAVWPAATTVSITLEPGEGSAATVVTLRHFGFEALPDGLEQFEGYRQGWASLNDLDALARMCEGG
jgi:uncharacterized protein YndB with AHSA1/START domain